ncbi:MAG: polyphenol oxidase family protein [Gemmatimonadota bacterium]
MSGATGGATPWRAVADWEERWPWLLARVTHPGTGGHPFDLRLFGGGSVGAADRWLSLRAESGFATVVHAPQVHGALVLVHDHLPDGLWITDPADGHATARPGVLLTVSVADCVPVFLVDPRRRALALLHAGRKGVAARILAAGLERLQALGSDPANVHVHLGPSICGRCYEVGPEIHEELGLSRPDGPTPVDLPALLRSQAEAGGVRSDQVSTSGECTRCSPRGRWFSHRAGDAGRQVGLLGMRA